MQADSRLDYYVLLFLLFLFFLFGGFYIEMTARETERGGKYSQGYELR